MKAQFRGNPKGKWIRHMKITRGGVFNITLSRTNWFSTYILRWPLVAFIKACGKQYTRPYGSMEEFEKDWLLK